MTVSVVWLFLTVLWVGLRCVIVVFPDNSHLCIFPAIVTKINMNDFKKQKQSAAVRRLETWHISHLQFCPFWLLPVMTFAVFSLQYAPRSDSSQMSSVIRVYSVCFHEKQCL